MKNIVITIDGGACCGKSSVAKELAKNLGFRFIDTGYLYRYMAYALEKKGVFYDDDIKEDQLVEIINNIEFTGSKLYVRGEELLDDKVLHTEEHSLVTSLYAEQPKLRETVTKMIIKTAEGDSVVADGRDCGSVIFPDADYKFYLEVKIENRVKRWADSRDYQVSAQEIEQGIKNLSERDERDKNRKYGPLCIPENAVVVNLDNMGIKEACEKLKKIVLVGESAIYMKKTSKQVKSQKTKLNRNWHPYHVRKQNVIRIENPKENQLILGTGDIRKSRITIYGTGNYVEIKDGYDIVNLNLLVRGNNNRIIIGEDFVVNYNTNAGALNISAKDDNNKIIIEEYAHIRGEAEIVCMEGTSLHIGKNFGMSSETIIRTGDGHRIFDCDTGERTNNAQSISIGNDCWVARRGIILKGVTLADYTILGTGALVTKSFPEPNIILGGNPAKIIKRNVTWLPGRR